MPRLLALFATIATLTGCAKHYDVYMDTQQQGQTGHYVVIESKMSGQGGMKVYDCLSMPNGSAWNPTCVKADMRGEAGGAIK